MSPNRPDRPNIVFFFTDDQRFDTLRALGNTRIHTPNLDRLCERGTAFTNATIMGGSCPAVCMPSRAMLHTSRTLFHIDREGQDIPREHLMLGETLQRAGYTTFGTGKWHNGRASFARSFACGDRIFFGGMSDHFAVPLNPFDPDGAYPEGKVYHEEKRHSSDLFSGAAIDFLQRYHNDPPFFLYLSFTAPHDPRETHPKFHALYDPDDLPTPESFQPEHPFDNGELRIRDEMLAPFPRTPAAVRQHLAAYYAMISHIDAAVGRVLATLDATGHGEDTIIVFAGDNGLAVGRHGLMGKQSVYDHSVHVPLLFAGPGIPAGERRDALVSLIDIYPTLCELVGADLPESVEGKSLVRAMENADEPVRDSLLFAYRHLHRGVRDRRHKLIEYHVDGARTSQLFDLAEDPHETSNLAGDPAHADTLRRLRAELLRWRDELDDPAEDFWGGFPAPE
jgi:arylsulfatase A-like enzyme